MLDTWEKILDPNFINAELIGPVGSERIVTIEDIDFRECFNSKTNAKEKKQSLIMKECKPLPLNKTNTKTLIKLFGADKPEMCVGKKVVLYVANVKVGKVQTTGIRIKEYSETLCEECGQPVKPAGNHSVDEMIEVSKRNTGRILCLACMKKAKEEQSA